MNFECSGASGKIASLNIVALLILYDNKKSNQLVSTIFLEPFCTIFMRDKKVPQSRQFRTFHINLMIKN